MKLRFRWMCTSWSWDLVAIQLTTVSAVAAEATFIGKVRGCYPSQITGTVCLDVFIMVNCFRQLLSGGVLMRNWEWLATTLREKTYFQFSGLCIIRIYVYIYIYIYIGVHKSRVPGHCGDYLLRWRLLSLDPEHETTFLTRRILRRLLNFRGEGRKLYIYIYIYIYAYTYSI